MVNLALHINRSKVGKNAMIELPYDNREDLMILDSLTVVEHIVAGCKTILSEYESLHESVSTEVNEEKRAMRRKFNELEKQLVRVSSERDIFAQKERESRKNVLEAREQVKASYLL